MAPRLRDSLRTASVPTIEPLEPRVLLSGDPLASGFSSPAAAEAPPVGVGPDVLLDSGTRKALFTDADGTEVKVVYKGAGSAALTFSGTVNAVTGGRKAVVEGASLSISGLSLQETTEADKLVIKTRGGTVEGTVVNTLAGSGPVGKIVGKEVILGGGGLSLTGDNGYAEKVILGGIDTKADFIMEGDAPEEIRLDLGTVAGGVEVQVASDVRKLVVDRAAGGTTLQIARVEKLVVENSLDANVTVTGEDAEGVSLGKLKAAHVGSANVDLAGSAEKVVAESWTGGSLSARDVGKLKVKGAAGLDLDLNAGGTSTADRVAKKIVAKGAVSSATWSIHGPVGKITAKDTVTGLTLSAGDVDKAVFGDAGTVNVTSTGTVGKMVADEWDSGTFEAGSVEKLVVRGDSGANVNLTDACQAGRYAAAKIRVKGWQRGNIDAAGHLGEVVLDGLDGGRIFAGVTGRDLPDEASDFSDAAIDDLVVKGVKGADASFINANIAARALTRVRIACPQTDNGGTPFGLAADAMDDVVLQTATSTETYRILRDIGDTDVLGDMVVRIV